MVRKNLRAYSSSGDSVTTSNSDSSYSSYNGQSSYESDSPSPSNSLAVLMACHQAWWSRYAPLASWITPDISDIPRFQGLIGLEPHLRFKHKSFASHWFRNANYTKWHFADYSLADIQPSQEMTNDPLANNDTRYEQHFHGEFDEVTNMLARSHRPGMSQGGTISSSLVVHLLEEDNTVGAWEDPYDYGWDDPTSIEPPAVELAVEDVANICKSDSSTDAQQEDDPDDGTDQPTVVHAGIEEDAYDCGWDDPSSVKPLTVESTMDNILHDCKLDGGMDAEQQDDPYDCRWQDGIDEPTVAPREKEEDAYDCGWDDPKSIEPPTVESAKEDGLHDCKSHGGTDAQQDEDPYDCKWQDGADELTVAPIWDDEMDAGQGIVALPLDVTAEHPYNCRWDAMDIDIPDSKLRDDLSSDGDISMTSIIFSCMKEPDDDIMAGRDLGTIDLTSPSASAATLHGGSPYQMKKEPGDDIMVGRNLGTIDLTSPSASPSTSLGALTNAFQQAGNAYIKQIVMPNVAPYNEQTPATIFTANRRLFGTYTEASNRVTELGEDVVAIFCLLDYHHRIMDPLDAMVLNLHGWEDE
ncbi:hypothetical protein EDD22DRAFT_850280 [Suillus occidentalis]|nr:hypothetical protein EDD22DRAFT_850280 [Suillus occidentalis]